jgi:hypothetical protein
VSESRNRHCRGSTIFILSCSLSVLFYAAIGIGGRAATVDTFGGHSDRFCLSGFELYWKNLEDPFENTVYDTPMTTLSRSIEINLRQSLREGELPPALEPKDGVLW